MANFTTLKSNFRGRIILPSDPGYDSARRIWNASIDRRPSAIARCTGTSDVAAAVRFARGNNLLTAIRGGGHNVGGRALCDDGIVIDLSAMRAVHVDSRARTVRIQGGATLGDLDRETHLFGLAVPCGIVPKTGIAGLTLGGGVGWLIRKYGMTIDNLLSCQVVTADGNVIEASAREHPDLFWALRGGGGNFGVVTSFEFRAQPVHSVVGGMLVHARNASFDVLRSFRDAIECAPDELTAYAAFLHTPDGAPATAFMLCYCGEAENADRVLAPIRAIGAPLVDALQKMPLPAMQSLLAPAFPDGNHNYWKSALLRSLPDGAISTLIDGANRITSPLSAIAVEYYGGAAGRIPNDATAFPHRDAPWDIVIAAQWTDAAQTENQLTWARDTERAVRQFSDGAHLLGAVDAEPQDVIDSAFGANLPRLAAIKGKYDPENFFRLNQNIRPAIGQSAAV